MRKILLNRFVRLLPAMVMLLLYLSDAEVAVGQLNEKRLSFRAGMVVSNISARKMRGSAFGPDFSGPFKPAVSIMLAADVEFPMKEALSVMTGLSFIGKGSSSPLVAENESRFMVVQLPLSLVKRFQISKSHLFAVAGIYLSYVAAGMPKDPDPPVDDVFKLHRIFIPDDDLFHRLDAGLSVVTGAEVGRRVKLQAGFDYGLAKMVRSYYGYALYNRSLNVSVGYRLGK